MADDVPPPEPDGRGPATSASSLAALEAWARAEEDAARLRAAEQAPPPVSPPPPTPAPGDAAGHAPTGDGGGAFTVLSRDEVETVVAGGEAGTDAGPTAGSIAGSIAAPAPAPSVPDLVPPELQGQPTHVTPTPAATPGAPPITPVTPVAPAPTAADVAVLEGDVDDEGELDELEDDDGLLDAEGPPGSVRLGPLWRWGFPALVLACALLVPALVFLGQEIVLQSTDGQVINRVTDPAAPGYQVITEPTPTLLLVQTDEAGTPNGLTVLSLAGQESGGMIFVPMTTVLEVPGVGNIPLDAAAANAGLEGLQKAVEGVLQVGMSEVAVVDPQGWADLVAPLGTLTVDNPDVVTVVGPDGVEAVRFPRGQVTLTPADVAEYLATRNPGENDLNRLVRHQAFWDAWLRAVGTSDDPGVVPGESGSGLGRFVRDLATDRVDAAPLPVRSSPIPGSDLAVYLPVADQVTALVARLVPFPVGAPPGARPKVRLLDGTGTLDHGIGAVALVVSAGGQVDQIGNADAFGVTTTRIEYADDARLPEVERLKAALGVGEIVKVPSAQTAIDVNVVLGADFAAQPPPSPAPVTTAVR